ncbi:MAG: hypothetical protein CSA62_14490 [Planctomycetota bacterium]|nr:MAG: hypothetical protein CSA62_14490 [Planctomycetota bacterium]
MSPRLLGLLLLLLTLLGSCAGTGAESYAEPQFAQRFYDEALRGDLLQGLGRQGEAVEIADRLLAQEPLFVPAHRLRQEYLRAQGQLGRAWEEWRQLRQRYGVTPETYYLEGRLLADRHQQLRHFREGCRRWPSSYWLRYAYSWSRSTQESEEQRAGELLLSSALDRRVPWPPITGLALRSLGEKAPKPLIQRQIELRELYPFDGRISLELALHGSFDLELLAEALDSGIASKAVLDMMARLPRCEREELLARIRKQEPLVERLLASGAVFPLADLALRAGRVWLAESWLRRSLELAETQGESVVQYGAARRCSVPEQLLLGLLVDRGSLAEAGELLRSILDPGLGPLLAPKGEALQRLLKPEARKLLLPNNVEDALSLLDSLLAVGQVELVERLAPRLAFRLPEASLGCEERAQAAARFLRFSDAMLQLLSSVREQDGDLRERGLKAVVQRLRVLSKAELGRDVVGEPRFLRFPFAGSFLDPFGPGLPAYFAEHGRYLLLGRLMGGPVGAVLGRKLSERILEPVPGLELAQESREVLLQYKEFVSFKRLDVSGVAGLAIWNHYFVDGRIARRWAKEASQRGASYGKLAEEGPALLGPDCPALCYEQPCQVDWRMLWRLQQEEAWDEQKMLGEVLRLLGLHERAHLVDAQGHLPVTQNLWRALGLFLGAGLSFDGLLADLEMRAECAALAFGGNVPLTLAHIAEFHRGYLRGARTQHARGFSELLRRLVQKWQADGAPGATEPERNLAAQLAEMPPDRARAYARAILAEEGFRPARPASASPASAR